MIKKKELLKNIRKYSAEEIAYAVKQGVVSLYELGKETEGAFTPLLKNKVKEQLEKDEFDLDKNDTIIPEIETPIINEEPKEEIDNKEEEPKKDNIGADGKIFMAPFSFKGRIRRKEYWISLFIYSIANYIIFEFINYLLHQSVFSASDILVLFWILNFIPLWFLLAQGSKRSHDIGYSGWLQLIPFYGLFLMFMSGNKDTNKYGNSPK